MAGEYIKDLVAPSQSRAVWQVWKMKDGRWSVVNCAMAIEQCNISNLPLTNDH
jgi:hypothetical protein